MENLRKIIWAVVSERVFINIENEDSRWEFLRKVNSEIARYPNMNFELFEHLMVKYD